MILGILDCVNDTSQFIMLIKNDININKEIEKVIFKDCDSSVHVPFSHYASSEWKFQLIF